MREARTTTEAALTTLTHPDLVAGQNKFDQASPGLVFALSCLCLLCLDRRRRGL